jgi:type IV/VI secretion system ImpK/VasF family protein
MHNNFSPTMAPTNAISTTVFEKHQLILRVTKELLYWSCLLRGCLYQFEIAKLHSLLTYKIEEVSLILSGHGCSAEEVDKVKFMLCTELDEAMVEYLDKGDLSRYKSLTEYYYRELGGEHFFDIIAAFLKSPHSNLAILSLGHIILCLGFKGQYALEENGLSRLSEIKDNLFFKIKKILPGPEFEVAPSVEIATRTSFIYKQMRTKIIPIFLLILAVAYWSFYRDLDKKVHQLRTIIQDNVAL